MLQKESVWIKNTISQHFGVNDFPLLNIGSSTEYFRKVIQPFIDLNIFSPLQTEGRAVIHTDIKPDIGVDLVGDLNDIQFRNVLKSKKVKSILCSNLLEHLESPALISVSIEDLLIKDGLLLVTVPRYYPYHKDPIDTMYRPDVKELSKLFPHCDIVTSEIVEEEGTFKKVLMSNKRYFIIIVLRCFSPFYKFSEWKFLIKDVFKWNKKFMVTCVLFKKR